MTSAEQPPGSGSPSRVLAPGVILLLGSATMAACLLLLFGPFYPEYRSPGQLLRSRLLLLLGPDGPRALWQLLENLFVPLVVVVLAVLLVLVPLGIASERQRRPRGPADDPRLARGILAGPPGTPLATARVHRSQRSTAVTFLDDGGIAGGGDAGELRRGIAELRLMARADGIPWHTDYETEGGARAFLEILRALHAGPVEARRGDEPDAVAWPSPATPMSAATAEVAEAEAAPVSDPREHPGDEARQGRPSADPSGSPSSSEPVYTPTTLYRPTSFGAQDEPGDEEER